MEKINKQRILEKIPEDKRHRLLGELTYLMLHSPLHRSYFINDIGSVFLPAIDCNQFRIYRLKNHPIGFLTWARLTNEVEKKYVAGSYNLCPDDWDAGNNIWIIDMISPFGYMRKIARDLKHNIFANDIGKAIRIDSRGQVRGIWKLHGVNRVGDAKGSTDGLQLKCKD